MTDMKRQTRITLTELIKRHDAIAERGNATQDIYVESLDATILVKTPSRATCLEAMRMPDDQAERADAFLIYECVVEPNLRDKELQEHFGCKEPLDIVAAIFMPGEIGTLAQECLRLAGYGNEVKAVADLKK